MIRKALMTAMLACLISAAFADGVPTPAFAQRMLAKGILGSISQSENIIEVTSGPLFAEGDAPSQLDTINELAAFYGRATPDADQLVFRDGTTGAIIATRDL